MMYDLFSSFDTMETVDKNFSGNIILSIPILILFMPLNRKLWVSDSPSSYITNFLLSLNFQFITINYLKNPKYWNGSMMVSFFFRSILFLNVSASLVFFLNINSHLSISFMYSSILFFWGIFILVGVGLLNISSFMMPQSTPWYLISFMSFVELISILVRCFTLAIRLSANLISGHILLHILTSSSEYLFLSNSVLSVVYIFTINIVEMFIGVIQAVVFLMLAWLHMATK